MDLYDAMKVEKIKRPVSYESESNLIRVLLEDINYGLELTFEVYHPASSVAKVVTLILLSCIRPDTNEAVVPKLEWRNMAIDAAMGHIISEMEWGQDYGEY